MNKSWLAVFKKENKNTVINQLQNLNCKLLLTINLDENEESISIKGPDNLNELIDENIMTLYPSKIREILHKVKYD